MIAIQKKVWIRLIEIVMAALLFIFGYITREWVDSNTNFYVVSVQSPNEITTAITDRDELQLTDRTNGKVRIYNKEILDAIYHQYNARKTYTQENRRPK